jgi:Matrixin
MSLSGRAAMRRLLLVSFLLLTGRLWAYNYVRTANGSPYHWPNRNIQYWINPAGSGLSNDQALTAIQSAFQSWEQTGVGLTFTFMGFTDAQNNLTDHKNVIFWSSDRTIVPVDAYGNTIVTADATTGDIQDVDIALNNKTGYSLTYPPECGGASISNLLGIPLIWNLTDQRFQFIIPGFDTYLVQVQATATHEIGHLLGLAHSTVLDASMSTVQVSPDFMCSTRQAVLSADDIAGIEFLYPSGNTIIYSNFTSGRSYCSGAAGTCGGWTVSGSTSTPGMVDTAVSFVPSQNIYLSQVLIALTWTGGTNSAVVTLNNDNGGLPGSTVYATWDLSRLPLYGSTSTIQSSQTLTSAPGILLTAGTTYWIVAAPGASDTYDVWNQDSPGTAVAFAQFLHGAWTANSGIYPPALEVTGTTTP